MNYFSLIRIIQNYSYKSRSYNFIWRVVDPTKVKVIFLARLRLASCLLYSLLLNFRFRNLKASDRYRFATQRRDFRKFPVAMQSLLIDQFLSVIGKTSPPTSTSEVRQSVDRQQVLYHFPNRLTYLSDQVETLLLNPL